MTALTITALVWTFMPFNTLQEAHQFMGALPTTACASASFGEARTDKEIEALEYSYKKEQKRIDDCLKREKKRNGNGLLISNCYGLAITVNHSWLRWIVQYKRAQPVRPRG